MNSFVRELTEEERAINEAIDAHVDAMKDEFMILKGLGATYLIGFPLLLFSPEHSRWERVGLALVMISLVLMVVHALLGIRTRRLRRKTIELMEPYQRRQAMPFYQELTEMFADKPGVHLHLNDNGSITVTDKRKKGVSDVCRPRIH